MLKKPRIIGVVNITQDSFYDGSRYLEPTAAIEYAFRLYDEGADVIELGPSASNPNAQPVTAAEEIRRIEPVIVALQARNIPIAIDSFYPDTHRYGISTGIDYLNDIQGFPDPTIYPEIAAHDCKLIVMHSMQRRGIATDETIPTETVLKFIEAFFETRIADLQAAGIAPERLILDPGMGFFLSNTPEPSLAVLQKLPELKERFPLLWLISVSRKSFIKRLGQCTVERAGSATLAVELFATLQGVDYIRTHDVFALKQALTMWQHLM